MTEKVDIFRRIFEKSAKKLMVERLNILPEEPREQHLGQVLHEALKLKFNISIIIIFH